MAKVCAICGKGSRMVGRYKKLRGKYNPLPKKRKYPNLQWARVPLQIKRPAFRKLAGKRALMCTKCIKTMAKRK